VRHGVLVAGMLGVCATVALVACEPREGCGSCGGGGTGSVAIGGAGGSGGGGGAGGFSECGGVGCCVDCPCTYTSNDTPAGCADVCDSTISGAPNPNYCNGANALAECAQCISDRCGEIATNCL
jgi:hypothetical protein